MPFNILRNAADGPRLLVSVRSEAEAAAAIAGGADIIDLKDPSRGSLGRPDAKVLEAVTQKAVAGEIPVTTALGEVHEWANATPMVIPEGLAFAKLGLAGLGNRAHWTQDWLAVRQRFDARHPSLRWVAVAYVDAAAAGAPPIEDVADAAIETGCAGFLLDTCDKSSGRLFDFVSAPQLDALADRLHSAGKFIAAAGRLDLSDVARLASSSVDVVAVRSAACEQCDRQTAVRAELVAACKTALALPKRSRGRGPGDLIAEDTAGRSSP